MAEDKKDEGENSARKKMGRQLPTAIGFITTRRYNNQSIMCVWGGGQDLGVASTDMVAMVFPLLPNIAAIFQTAIDVNPLFAP